jgi:Lon protease-like protein
MPLHVFEPRYRSLIKDSIRLQRRIGVAHTTRTLSPAKPNQSTAEILNSNQSTYEFWTIFSAGFAEILDVTADGRLIVEIAMDGRYEKIEEIQSIPYRVLNCKPYLDDSAAESAELIHSLRERLTEKLIQISRSLGDDIAQHLSTESWQSLSDEAFSFKIFQVIRFDPETMQTILEMKSPQQRLTHLTKALESNS